MRDAAIPCVRMYGEAGFVQCAHGLPRLYSLAVGGDVDLQLARMTRMVTVRRGGADHKLARLAVT